MAKSLKKPKMSAYPKKPKESASIEVWNRYHAKCTDVDKLNAKKISAYNAELRKRNEVVKKKRQIAERTSKMKAKTLSGLGKI